MGHEQQRRLQRIAEVAASKKMDDTRHKCFISYHSADVDEVATFLDTFGTEFIARTIGVTDEDDFIDSENTDYVMDQVRTKYLADSTVTIVLVGKCTWARRYVDWEVYSSLRASKYSTVNGLLAIRLPSGELQESKPPARVDDNVTRNTAGTDVGYARWNKYPVSAASLRNQISDAFAARTARNHLIVNSRARRINSAACS